MKLTPTCLFCVIVATAATATSITPQQHVLRPPNKPGDPPPHEGTGHLSEWSRTTKLDFLQDLSKNLAYEWIIVMGNEGGDLDSMASALAWSYHLAHLEHPIKAVALLQTDEDALDLRPENSLALHLATMSSGHRDLLTKDELPIKPFELSRRVKGIVLVDHNVPLAEWDKSRIISVIDHHEDAGLAPDAFPRIVTSSASCSSLVAQEILNAHERGDHRSDHDTLPVELIELLLRAIALDSGGLKKSKRFNVDVEVSKRLFKKSSWFNKDQDGSVKKRMKHLGQEMKIAKGNLSQLDVRDLLRRDWKGDDLPTSSIQYPTINVGFASIPYSMNEQIKNTPEQTPPEWFAIERAFTAEKGADVSICLTNSRNKSGHQVREIVLVVAHGWGRRLSRRAADDLFANLTHALSQTSKELTLKTWNRPDGHPLLPRRAVWVQIKGSDAGRKVIRPLVELAARQWNYEED